MFQVERTGNVDAGRRLAYGLGLLISGCVYFAHTVQGARK
jgi:hypothetical protein